MVGTFALEEHLKAVNAKLEPFDGKLDLSFLKDGFESFKPFTEPKRITTTCPPDPSTITWLIIDFGLMNVFSG